MPANVPPGHRLIVEGAGGVLVPINRQMLQVELFVQWRAPVVLCARTSLGTINHTLLSLEALQRRRVDVLGIVFVGEPMPDSEQTIVEFGDVKSLGRLPILPSLDAEALKSTFAASFDRRSFETSDEC